MDGYRLPKGRSHTHHVLNVIADMLGSAFRKAGAHLLFRSALYAYLTR